MSGDLAKRAEQAADNAWVKLVARFSLPILTAIGATAWSDLKEQGKAIDQVLLNQAVYASKMEDALRRIDRLEDAQARKTNINQASTAINRGGVDP